MIDTSVQSILATNGAAAKSGAEADPQETREWLVNTIPVDQQAHFPGDPEIEERLRHYVRWNALAMVVRANKDNSDLGGHLASFSSSATLYDVGFNHFWRGPSETSGGDLVYFQGHSAPGIYARAFLEGRISEEQLINFRREVDGKGISSYPHPWLMPDFWQFATVSMGLGPLQAIYQARYMRYLHDRGLSDTSDRKVWGFLGDGEVDEPESLAGLALAAREKLDNLIFVINCNRSSRASSAVPVGTSSRSCGARAGIRCSPPTTPGCSSSSWARRLTETIRPSSRVTAITCASSSSAAIPRRARWSSG